MVEPLELSAGDRGGFVTLVACDCGEHPNLAFGFESKWARKMPLSMDDVAAIERWCREFRESRAGEGSETF